MKGLGTKTLLALAAAGLILSAVPSAAAWVCTSKNAGGVTYAAAGRYLANVKAKAIAKCRANSVHPNTCYIVACT